MPSRVPAVTCADPRLDAAGSKILSLLRPTDDTHERCSCPVYALPHDPLLGAFHRQSAHGQPARIISAARVWGLSRA